VRWACLTPTEITAIGGAAVLVINAIFTGLAHLWSIRYTDAKTAQVRQDAGLPPSPDSPQ
jgi:hypothetical protein